MTSYPASRSARATILAPRSWPSRPGFATTIRKVSATATNIEPSHVAPGHRLALRAESQDPRSPARPEALDPDRAAGPVSGPPGPGLGDRAARRGRHPPRRRLVPALPPVRPGRDIRTGRAGLVVPR